MRPATVRSTGSSSVLRSLSGSSYPHMLKFQSLMRSLPEKLRVNWGPMSRAQMSPCSMWKKWTWSSGTPLASRKLRTSASSTASWTARLTWTCPLMARIISAIGSVDGNPALYSNVGQNIHMAW